MQQIEQFFQGRNPFSGKFSAKPRSGIRLQYLTQCHILYQSAAIRCAVQALVVNEDQPSVKGHLHIGFNAGCAKLKTLAECRHRILRANRGCAAMRKINDAVHLIKSLRLISIVCPSRYGLPFSYSTQLPETLSTKPRRILIQ
ncbi:hypothetical protein D3C81_1614770 [compost metagenome]